MSPDPFNLNLRGVRLDCSPGQVHVVGILNVTPDSFSDGGQFLDPTAAIARARTMVQEGATVIDVGGASSRPRGSVYGDGAQPISPAEELARVLPVVEGIAASIPGVLISVDTFSDRVAERVLEAGAHLINDITGLRDSPAIADLVAAAGAGLILMHSRGQVGSMPHEATYVSVVTEVSAFLRRAATTALRAGVESIVIDPGFGFGKTVSDNLRLIDETHRFVALGHPVMVGVSRKSSIGAALRSEEAPAPVPDRLFGSLGATAVAVLRGAALVRTHDVRATAQMLLVLQRVRGDATLKVLL